MATEAKTKFQFGKVIGTFGLVSSVVLVIFYILLMDKWSYYSQDAILGILIGIVVATICLILIILLDRNEKFRKFFQKGKLNFKWIVIFLLTVTIPFLVFLIFLTAAGMTFTTIDTNMDISIVRDTTFYVFSIIFIYLAGLYGYLGIKNFKETEPRSKIKSGFLALTTILFLIALPVGLYFAPAYGTVDQNYQWNDGPYLTWADDPETTVMISWLTKYSTPTKILFGESETSLTQKTFEGENTHLHHALITDLEPNTVYYYKIDGIQFSTEHSKDVFSFKTAPVSTSTEDFKFLVVGDMQPSDLRTVQGGETVAKGMVKALPDFICQLGDFTSSGGNIEDWHRSVTNMANYGAEIPFQSIIGNHDYGQDGSSNYDKALQYNYNSTPSNYYSFDYQNAHFVMIDNFDSGSYSMTEAQYGWVETDIKEAQDRGQKWVFVMFHHTMLTTGTSGHNWDLQKWLVPLSDELGVDAIFFGHDHHYEHWTLNYSQMDLYDPADEPTGHQTEIICTGGGGAHLEVSYGLLTHNPYETVRTFYDPVTKAEKNMTINREHWNADRYVDDPDNEQYADSASDKLYYHAPELESYSSDNDFYGYQYGEQTLHYMMVEITNNGNTCTISAHYPSGDMLMGPNGAIPQEWSIQK